MNTVKHYSDDLSVLHRWGELLIATGLLLLAGFFIVHQYTNTGFFTTKFGQIEMALLYGPLLLSFIDAVIQVVTGHRHLARPFEAASGLFLGVAAVWFLIVFPFDFTHLADVLPEGLRFILAWVTNDIGKIPLLIQVFVGPITAIGAIRAYLLSSR
jgi:hypothetical protein